LTAEFQEDGKESSLVQNFVTDLFSEIQNIDQELQSENFLKDKPMNIA
jgi:hypothetical protein